VSSVADIFRQRLIDLAQHADPPRILRAGQESVQPEQEARGSRYTHVADHFEIVVPIEGGTCIVAADSVIPVDVGEVLLIERGVSHSEIAREPMAAYEVFWFHLRGSSALLSETRFDPPATWTPVGPLAMEGRTDLESLAGTIASELAARSWGWQESVKGVLHYLCAIVIRRLDREGVAGLRFTEPPSVQADSRTWNIVRSVLEYCEGNYRRGVGLKEVAEALGYSPSYLSRLVTRHLGRSLSEHVHSRRIEAAKHLLEKDDLAVCEVASELGYSDPSHFTRAFSRFVGFPPREYRRRLGGL
jgi:AraC-like DNA-binding protein